MQRSGFNNARVRQANKQIFLSHLWREKQLSKSQLAQLTGLSIPAVSNILEELLDEGRLCHSRETLSQRGLSSGSFHLPVQGAWTLCINVTPTSLTSQLADARLVAVGDWQHEVINAATPDALLAAIANHWRRWRQRYPDTTINLALGVHGQVDPITGASKTMPQAPWKTPVEIKYLLEERLGIQVRLDNDCVMLALAEKWQNPAANEDFCVINVDYGIGSSFVIHDSIWRGSLYGSGQIGHTIVNPDGIACDCGRYGCLETVAANAAIEHRVRHLLAQGYQSKIPLDDCTIKTICKAANKGDALACEVIEHVGRHLGKTIAIAINLFNPQKVVIAGEIVEAEKVLLPAIEGCINTQALKAFRKNLPVVRSTLDHRSAIGAFALVKRAMLNGILLQRLLES